MKDERTCECCGLPALRRVRLRLLLLGNVSLLPETGPVSLSSGPVRLFGPAGIPVRDGI